MRRMQTGLTLLELLISVTLSMCMTLVLIQFYLQGSMSVDKQQSISRRLENAAALQHILSHTVRDALYVIYLSGPEAIDVDSMVSPFVDSGCAGVVVLQHCVAPVLAWKVGADGAPSIPGAVRGSNVLQVKQNCCPDVIADQFYLAHRGGVRSNPVSLYRRRMSRSGSYSAAVELVEGVSELTPGFIVDDALAGGLIVVGADQVSDWWRLRAVRIQYRLQDSASHIDGVDATNPLFTFTLASRQWREWKRADSKDSLKGVLADVF
jgi:hypothetical protein